MVQKRESKYRLWIILTLWLKKVNKYLYIICFIFILQLLHLCIRMFICTLKEGSKQICVNKHEYLYLMVR